MHDRQYYRPYSSDQIHDLRPRDKEVFRSGVLGARTGKLEVYGKEKEHYATGSAKKKATTSLD